jgi:hypothetical protein
MVTKKEGGREGGYKSDSVWNCGIGGYFKFECVLSL